MQPITIQDGFKLSSKVPSLKNSGEKIILLIKFIFTTISEVTIIVDLIKIGD